MENRNREALLDQLDWFADEIDAQAERLQAVSEDVFLSRSHDKGESLREVYVDLLREENEWKHFIGKETTEEGDRGNNSVSEPFSRSMDGAEAEHSGPDPFPNGSTISLMGEIAAARRRIVTLLRSSLESDALADSQNGMLYERTLRDAMRLRKLGEMVHERRTVLSVNRTGGAKR